MYSNKYTHNSTVLYYFDTKLNLNSTTKSIQFHLINCNIG